MIPPLRKIHRWVFFVLMILLPALLVSGIASRHSWATATQSQDPAAHSVASGATP
jgi:hypothetical protein